MTTHKEFPDLTPEAQAAHDAAVSAIQNGDAAAFLCARATISPNDLRRALAAFQREAIRQAKRTYWHYVRGELEAIAASLHNPPPPPTLAEAREADLSTPAGRDVVRDFLATLGEAGQP